MNRINGKLRHITLILIATFFFFMIGSFRPDEGMFPLNYLNITELKNAGLKLEAEDIFNPGEVSLTDALVKVGGCTGSFISKEGLIITNHHCVYGSVANLSDSSHNYLENGFVAQNHEQELPISMVCKITQSYEDVTQKVLDGITAEMLPEQRASKIAANIKRIVENENKIHPELSNEISEMFVGKSYTLFRYLALKDVRLVLAPPLTIGQFGGDRDNWEWPRHNGDFSLVRAYVGKDGKPASYNKDNVPFVPKNTLKINPNGTKEGDFVFIMGYPGRTFRHESGAYMKFQQQYQLPIIQEWYKTYIDYMKKFSEGNTNMQLAFAGEIQSLENVEKNYRGKIQGLRRTDIVSRRLEEDAQIMNAFVPNSPEDKQAKNVISTINEAWKLRSEIAASRFLLNVFIPNQSNAGLLAMQVNAYKKDYETKLTKLAKEEKEKLTADAVAKFKTDALQNYTIVSSAMEKQVIIDLLNRSYKTIYKNNTASKFGNADGLLPKVVAQINKSKYFDSGYVKSSLRKNALKFALTSDILVDILSELSVTGDFTNHIWAKTDLIMKSMMPQYIGLREQYLKSRFIPDANSTLRFTYGYIRSFSPNDGEINYPYTTLDGVFQKANTNSDYRLPQQFQDNLKQTDVPAIFKDPKTGKVIVGILYNLDTTGGNSGSPVLNSKGELIAINFDRSFTATINDYAWNENYSRSIGCDIRYVLYVMKYVGHAEHILKEIGVNL